MNHNQPTGTNANAAESQQQHTALELRRLAAEQGQFVATNEVAATVQRLLRIKAVTDQTGLSRSKVYLLIQEGQFPPPIKLGSRVAVWHEAAVNNWISQLVATSQKDNGVAA